MMTALFNKASTAVRRVFPPDGNVCRYFPSLRKLPEAKEFSPSCPTHRDFNVAVERLRSKAHEHDSTYVRQAVVLLEAVANLLNPELKACELKNINTVKRHAVYAQWHLDTNGFVCEYLEGLCSVVGKFLVERSKGHYTSAEYYLKEALALVDDPASGLEINFNSVRRSARKKIQQAAVGESSKNKKHPSQLVLLGLGDKKVFIESGGNRIMYDGMVLSHKTHPWILRTVFDQLRTGSVTN